MATIYIDNQPYEVSDGQNLLRACLSLGFNLPYFCWHPAMHSVGACRQCAVKQFKDEHDTRGRIVMACMTVAADGTRISIEDPEARRFRAGVIEFLMVNHPHDCPVCDEGGECHLQDMTVMTGHAYRRFRFKKRTHRNQDLGPFVNHEMNRCIACYRCVRFYRDYAGGRDFEVFQWHDDVYFGRQSDGVLENEFSGNLVEVCPTGVFTDKTLKQHYTRKWDLQTAPSVCVHCGLGCNTIPGERYGLLRRIRNRYNRDVNGYFLCDRGRYGYEFVNSPRRIRQPMLRKERGQTTVAADRQAALEQVAKMLGPGERVLGIGSPRASLEANFALRTLVGAEQFYRGMSEQECRRIDTVLALLREGPARSASMHEASQSDAVLVLGEDLTNTAPMLAYSVRQSTLQREIDLTKGLHIPWWDDAAIREALQQRRGPLYIATCAATKLDDVASQVYRGAPDDLVRFGQAVAHGLAAAVPPVSGLPPDLAMLADTVAETLYLASRPVIVCGTCCGSETLLRVAANIAWALCAAGHPAQLCFTVPECNSLGLGLMRGGSLSDACHAIEQGRGETIVVLENDLSRHADEAILKRLHEARRIVVLDYLEHATTAAADLVLPAATFAESDGTIVNNEGRAQRFYQVFVPQGEIQASWWWLQEIMVVQGRAESAAWTNWDALVAALADTMPEFKGAEDIAPPAGFRLAAQKVPRQPHRYSGRTAMAANVNVHEARPPADPDSPLAFSMEGYDGQPPAPLVPRFWAPGWNSIQSVTRFQEEVNGPLRGGEAGRRLLEPRRETAVPYFSDVPASFEPRQDQWLLVPLHHIFGSEELSTLAPGVAERTPPPYLALSPDDAARLGIHEEDPVVVELDGVPWSLVARAMPSLPQGVAGLPVGLPGMPYVALPRWARLARGTVS